MAIYTLDGTDKEITVQGRYASVKNNGSETVYASSTPDFSLDAPDIVPVQAGESVVVRDCKKKLYVRGNGQIAVASGNEPFNFFKPAPKGGGGSGDGITQQQLNDTLKAYATNASIDTKLEGYAEKSEIPASLPANGGNADTVGGKSAEELVQSNPNLLDNSDFRINQREQDVYDSGYTIDRWGIYTSDSGKGRAQVTVLDEGIKISSVISDRVSLMFQTIEKSEELSGRTLTLSAEITQVTSRKGGIRIQMVSQDNTSTFSPYVTASNPGVYKVSVVVPNDTKRITIQLVGSDTRDNNPDTVGSYVVYKWAKLEVGDVATPFVPPHPATELLKCQRYYQRLGGLMRHIGSGFIFGTTAAIICPLATTMRVTGPTITVNGTMYVWTKDHAGSSGLQSTELASNHAVSNAALTLPIKIDNDSALNGCGATLQFRDTESYIALSADL